MPLTELIIDGFKSFADKTTIQFGNGISGIVGPNGSGKSNITEAIRWAMGESRAKTLRGNNMKDVIFAGSEFRKPLNSAQVTLVFDNKDRKLNFSSDKVAITRKILRSGESNYSINNQNVRLKDVRELFLDSGLSQNSLAIISQGRVDQILNSRPEERRDIFEEAAGVLHFKQQKEAAESQLQKTNDNLIRINDLVKELENRIEPLHEQSSLAKEYKFQKKGLDEKLKTLLAFEIQTLNQKKQAVKDDADKNQVLLTKLDSEVKESQAAVTQKRNEYKLLQAKREKLQQKLLEITQQFSDLNTNLQVEEQSKRFDEATKTEYQKQISELKDQIAKIKRELDNLVEEKNNLAIKKDELQAKKDSLTGNLKEKPDQLNKKLERQRSNYIQLLQDQTSINNKLVYLKNEYQRASEDKNEQNNNIETQLQKAQQDLKQLQGQGQKLTKKRRENKDQLDKYNQTRANLDLKITELRQQVSKTRNLLQKFKARHDALVNIQKRHEGYYFGVRNVLNHLDQYPGVIGVVGELITFSQELEAAMTTALGAGVQNLVTDSRMSARNAINALKQNHAGRATFLPLDGLRQHVIPDSTVNTLKTFKGFIGVASQLVTSSSNIDILNAINYLLGSVIIVDNIDTALAIKQRVNRYRVVTLDGDVISPGGSMTGGVKNQRNDSPLQTTAEINSLKEKIDSQQRELVSWQKDLDKQVADQQSITKKLTDLQNKVQELNQEINETALSYQNQEKEVKRLQDANNLFISRQNQRRQELNELSENIKQAKEKQEQLAENAEQAKIKMNDLQERIKNFNELSKSIQDKLSRLDPELAVYSNKLENLLSKQKERQVDLEQNQSQLDNLEEKLAALSKNRENSSHKKEDLQQKRASLQNTRKQYEVELSQLAAKLGRFDAQINQLDQVASRNYDLRKDAAEQQEQFSIKITKISSLMDQKLNTLSEDYSLTYEAAISQAKGDNTEEFRQKLKKAVKLHRMSIEDIGPVNLDSIEEYENVKKRYDFLNGQQNDLLSARSDLEESMTELDKEVKVRFSTAFTNISESFTKIFPIVFGGGNAKLVLTDPDDMLKTGVEIIAQPPGKKLQKLSLLSGGERALTAITLLFAMLQINPVPFCVLDEVEAALDDANIARFARFLQKYDMHTQFIVITHRRGTMRQADRLFGVVMQELGVSKVVSVSLNDIKDEVNQ